MKVAKVMRNNRMRHTRTREKRSLTISGLQGFSLSTKLGLFLNLLDSFATGVNSTESNRSEADCRVVLDFGLKLATVLIGLQCNVFRSDLNIPVVAFKARVNVDELVLLLLVRALRK